MRELEPGLLELTAEPKVGIGQSAFVISGDAGTVLWDPPGFVDDEAVERVRALGEVLAISASHPHMFGAQLEWSRRLGDAPVLVSRAEPRMGVAHGPGDQRASRPPRDRARADAAPVRRPFPRQHGAALGGMAPAARGVLLSSDTIHANPDRATVTFLRSYPNRIPLSPAVVERITSAAEQLAVRSPLRQLRAR